MARKPRTNSASITENVETATPVVEQTTPEQTPEQTIPEQTVNVETSTPAQTPETPVVETPEAGWIIRAAGSVQLHEVATVAMPKFSATCGRTFVAGDAATDRDQKLMAFCAYCLDRVAAPADATDEKPLKVTRTRTPKPETATSKPPIFVLGSAYAEIARRAGLPNFGRTGDAVARAINSLSDARIELANVPNGSDARALVDVLNATLTALRPVAAKRAASTPGTPGLAIVRAARGEYETPERASDSPELGEIRRFANAGDVRAIELVAHCDAYADKADDVVCPHCKSDKHVRKTGFFSAGREIAKMRERAATAESTPAAETAPADVETPAVVETVPVVEPEQIAA